MQMKKPTVPNQQTINLDAAILASHQAALVAHEQAPNHVDKHHKLSVDGGQDALASVATGDDAASGGVPAVSAESSGGEIHLAEAVTTTTDAAPAEAGSVPSDSAGAADASAATAPSATVELGHGLLIAAGILGVAALAGSGGGGGGSSTPTPADKVADGYVKGAEIWVDTGTPGHPNLVDTGVQTDANGNFTLPGTLPGGVAFPSSYVIVAKGGVNIDTGIANTLVLTAPSGSTMVTPLTTLVQAYVAANGGTAAAAETVVQNALGLGAQSVDLLTYDPLAQSNTDATAIAVQKATAEVASVIILASANPNHDASASNVANTVIGNLVTAIGAGSVDLTNTTTLTALLSDGMGGSISSVSAGAISTATNAINGAANLTGISTSEGANLHATAPLSAPILLAASDSGASHSDHLTNATTPTVQVTLSNPLSTAVVHAGDTITLYDGATQVGSAVLTASDLTNTYVNITTTALVEGTHTLTATDLPAGGTASAASSALVVTIDTTLATPTVALTHDTGSSATDNITNDASLSFSAVATDVTRTITVDGGAASSTYTAPSADGSHTVLVTDTDVAGNIHTASLTFTLDKTIATPTVALTHDTGSSSVDNITNNASLTLSAAASGVTRSITVDGGSASATYTAPTVDGSHTVVVTDTDTAGNTATASLTFTLDTTIATPTVALLHDTGSSNTDKLTNDASLSLSAAASGVTRSYSVDGGSASASYTAPSADGPHTVLVTDTDIAGNTASASLTFTLDKTIATPTVALTHDTGSSGVDKITSDASLTLSSMASDVTRTYQLDGGTLSSTYTAPSANGSHTVVVTDTDTAGNVATASLTFTLDTIIATPTVALAQDTGNATDLITSNASLSLSAAASDVTRSYSVDGGSASASYTAPTLDGSHTVVVTDTDTAGNTAHASLTFTLDTTAPTFTSGASATFADHASGTVYTAAATDIHSPLSYSLSGADAGLFHIDASSGAVTFASAPSSAGVDHINVLATDVAGNTATQAVTVNVVDAPSLSASSLNGVANLDPTSAIVLHFSEAVTAGSGTIHLVNATTGTGFEGQTAFNSENISVADTSQVHISSDGLTVTINPTYNLDLSSHYDINIDQGAFVGTSSHLGSVAVVGSTSLDFHTVTPGATGALTGAVQSVDMTATGTLANSYQWLDMNGIGSPSNKSSVALDLSAGHYALVAQNYDTGGANPTAGYDGIVAGEFWIAANNFNGTDLIYIDNQKNGVVNDLSVDGLSNNGSAPSTLQLAGSSIDGAHTANSYGGLIDITLQNSTAGYDSITAIQSALHLTAPNIIVG